MINNFTVQFVKSYLYDKKNKREQLDFLLGENIENETCEMYYKIFNSIDLIELNSDVKHLRIHDKYCQWQRKASEIAKDLNVSKNTVINNQRQYLQYIINKLDQELIEFLKNNEL